MHYTDREQLEENKLVFILYTHEILHSKKKDFDLDITSIHECKFFEPRLLWQLLKETNKFLKKKHPEIFKQLQDLEEENFYKITLKQTDWETFEIIDIETVSENQNRFYQLH